MKYMSGAMAPVALNSVPVLVSTLNTERSPVRRIGPWSTMTWPSGPQASVRVSGRIAGASRTITMAAIIRAFMETSFFRQDESMGRWRILGRWLSIPPGGSR